MTQPSGFLPYFLVYTSISAFIHAVVCYVSPPSAALRAFSGPQRPAHTSLLAHVYAMKNVYTAAIRACAAYDITNRTVYYLTILTFAGVLWLYVLEHLVYRTVRWKEAWIPYVNAGVGLTWMVMMQGWYLSA